MKLFDNFHFRTNFISVLKLRPIFVNSSIFQLMKVFLYELNIWCRRHREPEFTAKRGFIVSDVTIYEANSKVVTGSREIRQR